MFKTEGSINPSAFQYEVAELNRNYKLKANDRLTVNVYLDRGERLIDPNSDPELPQVSPQMTQQQNAINNYFIQENGEVKLPMVGFVKVEGLTIYQADSTIAEAYSKFYKDVFVMTSVQNRRVFLLGGIKAQVLMMPNENMNLIEALAMAGGVEVNGRVKNIRLIRGDLKDPSVQVIDLSTIQGLKAADLKLQPNDIIYIEPVYKVVTTAISDVAPLLLLAGNLIVILILLTQ